MSIYNKKTNFLVIDIETCLVSNNFIFDLSYVVYNRLQGIVESASYIVKENYNKPTFYNKQDKYQEYLDNKVYGVKQFKGIIQDLETLIKQYDLKYVCAFNSSFDLGKIDMLCTRKGIVNPLVNLTEFDLYHTACQTIAQQSLFKKFVDRFNIKSEKGNRKTGAEAIYQYMTANPDFIEEHTGYSDLRIEVEILDLILRQKKKMDIRPNSKAWKLAQG